MGSSAIVSGTIPIAVGAALTIKRHNTNQVSVAFFGDGATDEGIFYESINLSVLYNLPVIFVCENNDFATHLPNRMRQSNISVTERINGFKINSKNVDGNNPIEIYEVAGEMIERARKNCAPSLLECTTYRWLSHAGYWQDLDVGYRRKEDVEFWMNKCPIKYLYNYLKLDQKIDENQFELMKTEIRKKVTDAVLFARNSRSPNILNLDKGL
jgi:pyruvate dehydrogenase E1 component alpha subunit